MLINLGQHLQKISFRISYRSFKFLNQGTEEENISFLRTKLKKHPFVLFGHFELARLYFLDKKYNLAELALIAPIRFEKKTTDLYYNSGLLLVKVYLATGRITELRDFSEKLKQCSLSDLQKDLLTEELAAAAMIVGEEELAAEYLSKIATRSDVPEVQSAKELLDFRRE